MSTSTLDTKIKDYQKLEELLYTYGYAMSRIYIDGDTQDPPKGAAARGEVLAILDTQAHELLCSKETGQLIDELLEHSDELDEQLQAQLRVMKRDRERQVSIPADESADYTRLVTEAADVWHRAKLANDWESFEPYIDKLVQTMKRHANYKNPEADPYDVWLNEFEPGTSREFYDRFFEQVKSCVVPLVADIQKRGTQPDTRCLEGNFDAHVQWDLAEELMRLEGLDMDAIVLLKTEHPFSDSLVSGHAFIASHVYEDNVISNVYSMLHEGGHALYEQGVNPAYDFTCLAGGTAMGMHESQSRFFENYIGRSRAFAPVLLNTLAQFFPERFSSVSVDEFYKAVNKAEPSLIRTEADELTYVLHIIVRYEIEQALFAGEAAAADVPVLWAEKYKQYLGVEVPNYTEGPLQDTHWSGGMFGYFPTYALGSAYGAQYLAKMRAEGLNFEEICASGDLSLIRSWLGQHIWTYGRSKDPAELIEAACGESFDAHYFTDYITEKFTDIYQL